MVTQSGIEIWDTSRSVVVTQSGIEIWDTKVSGGHSEWYRDGTHQGQWWSLRVV